LPAGGEVTRYIVFDVDDSALGFILVIYGAGDHRIQLGM
jgi:hypothetical protein